MRKALKFSFVAALVVLLFSTAVACGGNGDDGSPTPTPADGTSLTGENFTKQGETYSFYSWQYNSENPYAGDDERNQQMRERVERLQNEYGITIQFVTQNSGSVLLQSAFQGMPEVTGMKEGGLHTMMDTYLYQNVPGTCLTPLSDHSDVYDFNNENKFNVYSQYDLCEYNDNLWYFIPIELGVHFECGGNALVFNKKLVEANGYSAETIYEWVNNGEWTWDKFEEVLIACTNRDQGIWGIQRGNEALVMWSLANSNGTEFVTLETHADGSKQDSFVYTGDKGERLMAAYDEFIKLANTLQVMDTTYYTLMDKTPLENFQKGSVAFYYNGYSTNALREISKMEEDYGLVPWPKGPNNVANENKYYSFYPHLNPYCVFRNETGNVKGAVQILCELYTPIYDANSEDAQALYESERQQFTRDEESAKNLDLVEANKEHFRVFMYSKAPCTIGKATQIRDVLFGKGEDDILAQTTSARQYFDGIANAVNQAIYERSPYTWK